MFQYRIVIPQLHISLREGCWYVGDEEYSDDDDDVDSDSGYQCGVFLAYAQDEKDIDAYKWAVGPWLDDAIMQMCEDIDFSVDEAGNLECYLEFDG